MVYLIHFQTPYKHARHYLGSSNDVLARCEEHRNGSGARLMQVVEDAKIPWQVVRLWPGGRKEEKQLKLQKNSPRLCPICNGRRSR